MTQSHPDQGQHHSQAGFRWTHLRLVPGFISLTHSTNISYRGPGRLSDFLFQFSPFQGPKLLHILQDPATRTPSSRKERAAVLILTWEGVASSIFTLQLGRTRSPLCWGIAEQGPQLCRRSPFRSAELRPFQAGPRRRPQKPRQTERTARRGRAPAAGAAERARCVLMNDAVMARPGRPLPPPLTKPPGLRARCHPE